MRKNKNRTKIILATTVAILAMIISYTAFSNMNSQLSEKQKLIDVMQKTQADTGTEQKFVYAVSTTNLKAGQIVADEDVNFKEFPSENPTAFENSSDVVNKVLLQDINSGETFTSAQIAKISNDDTTLKDGYRALTLPTDGFQGRSDKMTPGVLVDIYSADSQSGWSIEGVKIIGLEGGDVLTKATSITFEVSTDEISDFISNVSKSKLVLVARNPGDKKVEKHSRKSSKMANRLPSFSSPSSFSPISNLPSSPPISNFSGLPQPSAPVMQTDSVELIEANVKSKVTFE